MGLELYETQPAFRESIDRSEQILRAHLDRSIVSVLYEQSNAALLDDTAYTQPALFAVEYALVELWRSWGIEPAAVMGHSLGEDVAACVAGVFSLEDGLRMVAERGRLMRALPDTGLMAAVFAGESRVREALAGLGDEVSIAAVNGPENVVLSGARPAVEHLLTRFHREGVKVRTLRSSRACHSRHMDPILGDVERLASQMTFRAPEITLVSTVTGGVAPLEQLSNLSHWSSHIRGPVRFQAAVDTLVASGHRIFVEIGPGSTAIGMARRSVNVSDAVWLPSLAAGHETATVLNTLGALYTHGVNVDWTAFDRPFQRSKVALPTYPFERRRFWVETETRPAGSPAQATASQPVQAAYEIVWEPASNAPASTQPTEASGAWMIVADRRGIGTALARQLDARGIRALVVPGDDITSAVSDFQRSAETCAGVGRRSVRSRGHRGPFIGFVRCGARAGGEVDPGQAAARRRRTRY